MVAVGVSQAVETLAAALAALEQLDETVRVEVDRRRIIDCVRTNGHGAGDRLATREADRGSGDGNLKEGVAREYQRLADLQQSVEHRIVDTGTLSSHITYNSENGTCIDSFSVTIENDNLKIDNGSFLIYPNPSNGPLFIENKNATIIDAIVISNSLGVEVFYKKLHKKNEINYSIGLDFLTKGVYTMTIISGSTTLNYKLLRN